MSSKTKSRAEYFANWCKENYEKLQATRKRFYENHKEDLKQKTRKYYQENREAILEKKRSQYQPQLQPQPIPAVIISSIFLPRERASNPDSLANAVAFKDPFLMTFD